MNAYPAAAALRAEWTKLRTLRSTWLVLLAATLVGAVAAVLSVRHAVRVNPDSTGSDIVQASLDGLLFTQFAFGVLGALAVTSEYATATIRTTLTAVPCRGLVFAAKGAVVGALALAAGFVVSFVSYLAGQAAVPTGLPHQSPLSPGVLHAIGGGGLYLLLLAMVGFGLGVLVRRTAGALALLGLVPAEAVLANLTLPDDSPLNNDVLWWAGQALAAPIPRAHYPSGTLAALVCAGYAAAVLIPAVLVLRRRDA